jgi:hypothetical protein
LVALVVAAVLFLGVGFVLAQFVTSPGELEARQRPPAAGLITGKVERRQISSTVIARAEVSFADPVAVNPSVPTGATSAVVTGHVPKVGDAVRAGDVLLEVSGRPIFALSGKFPSYRSLAAGMSGPDVSMLRKALSALGYRAGAKSDVYDAALAGAVARLYADHGYSAPDADDKAKVEAVRDAKDAVTDSQADLKAAKRELKNAGEDSDKAALKAAVATAKRAVTRARETLRDAQSDALTPLPASEVVFLTALPRRVDVANVRLGGVVGEDVLSSGNGDVEDTAALVLSGDKISVSAQVSLAEAALLKVGAAVVLSGPDGDIRGEVSSVCAEAGEVDQSGSGDDADGRCEVGISLGDLDGVDRSNLLGNFQADIEVGVSDAEALVVPLSAVSADASGKARVQRIVGALVKDGPEDAQSTEWVSVESGLSAEGYVEVKSSSPALREGDLVVLGVAGDISDGSEGTDDPDNPYGADDSDGVDALPESPR